MRKAFISKYIERETIGLGSHKTTVTGTGIYEETFTIPVTFLEFSHHYDNNKYSRVAIVEMEDGTIELIPLYRLSFKKSGEVRGTMIYLSKYHYGDLNGNQRFFDETTSEMFFKFLDNQIKVRFEKELKFMPESDAIVYYCSSAGGNYFFSMKTGIDQCLILTSY